MRRASRERPLYRLPNATRAARQAVARNTLAAVFVDSLLALLITNAWTAQALYFDRALGVPWGVLDPGARRWALVVAVGGPAIVGVGCWFRRTRPAALLVTPLLALPILLSIAPRVDPVFSFFRWQHRWESVRALTPIFDQGFAVLAGSFGLLLVPTLAYAAVALSRLRETGDTHGSAHWASPREIRQTGLLKGRPGVVAGTVRIHGRTRVLRDASDRHVLLYAPSGSGKTTSVVLPTLREWSGSVLATDIKGELWHHTAKLREEKLGQRSLRFDPASNDGSGARYNPLQAIPDGEGDVRAAQALAEILANPDGVDRSPDFWELSARAFLTGLLLHVRYAGTEKTLGECARALADKGRPIADLLTWMLSADHAEDLDRGWLDSEMGARTRTHPVVAGAAQAIQDLTERTSSGILATARSYLDVFRDPIVEANTSASDFSARDLAPAAPPVSLYLVVAPADLGRLRGLVRVVLHQLVQGLTEKMDFAAGAPPPPRLLLALEEFPSWGKLDFLGRAIAYLRGYGIKALVSVQSLAQLHEVYGQHESISGNCAIQIAFAPNDLETAKRLSEMTGTQTVSFDRRSYQGGGGPWAGARTSVNPVELGRPLLTPDEVRRLPAEECLVFVAGRAVVRGRRLAIGR